MPLFALRSYHRTACTVGLGMAAAAAAVVVGRLYFPLSLVPRALKEHLNTHSKSYRVAAVRLKCVF